MNAPRAELLRGPLLLALILCMTAGPAASDVHTTLSWSGCTPTGSITMHREYSAESHVVTLSMTSTDSLNIQAFEAGWMVASVGSGLGDAWRFEQGGCNSGGLSHALGSPAQGCPSAFSTGSVSYVTFAYDGSRGIIRLGAQGPPRILEAGRRHVLGELHFDLSLAVAGADAPPDRCACGDRATCILTTSLSFLNADGSRTQGPGWGEWVTWASPLGCDFPDLCNPCVVESTCVRSVVPARAATWGAIKNQYRMRSR